MANVKLIRTLVGEDIVAEIVSDDASGMRVKNPCQIGLVMTDSGQPTLNIQRMLTFSTESEVDVNKSLLLYVTTVDPKIEMKYNEIFGNIIVASQPRIFTG